jgi:hypothetical protein
MHSREQKDVRSVERQIRKTSAVVLIVDQNLSYVTAMSRSKTLLIYSSCNYVEYVLRRSVAIS